MAVTDFLSHVPNAVTISFATIGLLYLFSKVLSYAILLLELFVLKGTNVCPLSRF